ncbi:MAG TPA: heavy metal-associated domain-containing protein [Dehalococcoidia bacterium]|nr:heavy metal-associated domain-containing protein [Dehalococcoidia bacterium]
MRVYWRRLLYRPRAVVTAREGEAVTLRIEGLVCDLCAARARRGLLSLPGVERATVDLEAGTARVWCAPSTPDGALEGAVASTVILPRLRWLLDRVRRALAWPGRGAA